MVTRHESALLLAAALLAVPARAQQSDTHLFSLKRDTVRTGTSILEKVAVANIPLEKPYEQLTPQQVAMVKAAYQSMAPEDEPPFPAAGLQSLVRAVAKASAVMDLRGLVSAVVTIGPDGKARKVDIYAAPSPAAGQVIGQLLMLERYKPARCGGQACTMDFPFNYACE